LPPASRRIRGNQVVRPQRMHLQRVPSCLARAALRARDVVLNRHPAIAPGRVALRRVSSASAASLQQLRRPVKKTARMDMRCVNGSGSGFESRQGAALGGAALLLRGRGGQGGSLGIPSADPPRSRWRGSPAAGTASAQRCLAGARFVAPSRRSLARWRSNQAHPEAAGGARNACPVS
jgi:hypothetical protein